MKSLERFLERALGFEVALQALVMLMQGSWLGMGTQRIRDPLQVVGLGPKTSPLIL